MTSRHAFTSTLGFASPNASTTFSRAYHTSRSLSRGRDWKQWGHIGKPEVQGQHSLDFFPTEIRNLMRPVPHALTIITSFYPSIHNEDGSKTPGEQHGLLVSSFNTVTLSPKPFVSFNIKLPSKTYSAITASRFFTASGIDNPRTAGAFVHGKHSGWKEMVEASGRLKKGMGGLWWMRCEWVDNTSVRIEDHMIVVGRVKEAGRYEDEGPGCKRLVYADGEYWRLGGIAGDRGGEPPENQ